jgi:import inner membrane translocase subunit TIM22
MNHANESTNIPSPYGSNGIVKGIPLPFFKPLNFVKPSRPDELPLNPGWASEACGIKIITGGVSGAVLGVGLGLFMGAMGDVSPIQIVNGREVPQAPLREQMRAAYKATANKALGWCKTFGVMTALFGGVECVIEKYRAKHDVWNGVSSGCVVGATISAKSGPGVSS